MTFHAIRPPGSSLDTLQKPETDHGRRHPLNRASFVTRTISILAGLFLTCLVAPISLAQHAHNNLAPDLDVRGARTVTLTDPPFFLEPARSQALESLREDAAVREPVLYWSSLTETPSRIHARGRPLMPEAFGSPREIALNFLSRHASIWNLEPVDLGRVYFSRDFITDHNRITHLTLQQTVGGIDIYGGALKINVSSRGEIINVSGEPIAGAHRYVNTMSPHFDSVEAVSYAAEATGRSLVLDSDVLGLVLFPMAANDLRLAWHLTFETIGDRHLYEAVVDATDGRLLFRRSLTHYNHIPAHGDVYTTAPIPYTPLGTAPSTPIPRENRPFHGGDFFPHNAPHFDWWAGQPRNTTISNFVDTYADRLGDNAPDPGSYPTPGPGEDFTFPLDLADDPADYQDASVANLFYWNNRLHNFFYSIGFNEVAGNFQEDNFGLGGAGGDPVLAETQDNAEPADPDADPSLCNANMSTPFADGNSPRMQMFVCDRSTPFRDSSLEPIIIGHEYAHGVHTRLVPTTGNQRANEGWADYFGLAVVAEPGDPYDGSYSVGNYFFNNQGIRSSPYSTRPDVYPRRFADINDAARCQFGLCSNDNTQVCGNNDECGGDNDSCNRPVCGFHEDCQPPVASDDLGICTVGVHRTGELWANALWIARQHLIAKHGFSAGDLRMNKMVIDGMKLSPDNPTFLDGRDAILMADFQNHAGTHACLIWDAFAKMGMGYSAQTTDVDDINPLQAFDMPAECSPVMQMNTDSNFGNICLEDTATRSLQLFNQGNGDLIVTGIERVSGSTDITIEDHPVMPAFIGSNAHIDFTVRCTPSSGGNKSATIQITSNDESSPHTIEYQCTGGEAQIATTFDGEFGNVCLESTLTHELRISNTGTCQLGVSNITSNNAQWTIAEVLSYPLKISAGSEVTVPIKFDPQGTFGARSGAISVHHDGVNVSSPRVLSVSGNSPPGSLNTALANQGEFGNVCKGDHADLSLTLFNQGQCNLTIAGIDIDPDGSSFQLPSDTTFPLVLSPDADFNVPVRYAPEVCNDEVEEAKIVIDNDDPDKPMFEIDISGTSSCPRLVIDPESLDGLFAFPPTVVDTDGTLGCHSDASVVLRNNGGCPLTIDGISAEGLADVLDFAVTAPSQFPIVLPAGEETLNVNVRFTPQADGDPLTPEEVLGMLQVASDDPDAAGTAELCGESAAQSGVRMLVTDVTANDPVIVDPVERIDLRSKGISQPGPVRLRFTNAQAKTAEICGRSFSYHVHQEDLPSTDATGGGGNKSSYEASAKNGNLQTSQIFTLGQCEFRDFQLQLSSSGDPDPGNPGGNMSVGAIELSVRTRGPWLTGEALVTIIDEGGNPVGSATVSGSFTGDVGGSDSDSTNSGGVAALESNRVRADSISFQFCVDDVSHSSHDYDPGANAVTCVNF
jgi:hypothetical protein